MGRPLSGKTAPQGRPSLIERFGGTVSEPKPKAVVEAKPVAAESKPAASSKQFTKKSAPTPAPVAGTKGGAEARKKALAANEEKMKAVRAKLAANKK